MDRLPDCVDNSPAVLLIADKLFEQQRFNQMIFQTSGAPYSGIVQTSLCFCNGGRRPAFHDRGQETNGHRCRIFVISFSFA